jgi:hypothetical protein
MTPIPKEYEIRKSTRKHKKYDVPVERKRTRDVSVFAMLFFVHPTATTFDRLVVCQIAAHEQLATDVFSVAHGFLGCGGVRATL